MPLNRWKATLIAGLLLAAVACQPNVSTQAPLTLPTANPNLAFEAASPATSPCMGVKDPEPIKVSGVSKFTAPKVVIDVDHIYCAIIKTDKGRIVAQLYPKYAPQNVNSFVFLANQGYYDNLTWHRVLADFMAQTGDPTGTGAGNPGYSLPLEVHPNVKYDREGVIGAARAQDPNTAGSQFFITVAPQPGLDPNSRSAGYTIIGQVVDGMNIVRSIKLRDPQVDTFAADPLVSVRVVDLGAAK